MPDAPGALPLSCGKAHCGAIGLCKARGVMRDGALASLFNRPLKGNHETARCAGGRHGPSTDAGGRLPAYDPGSEPAGVKQSIAMDG